MKCIGEDVKTAQFGRPLGMPLVKHLESEYLFQSYDLQKRVSIPMSNGKNYLLHYFLLHIFFFLFYLLSLQIYAFLKQTLFVFFHRKQDL
jgi:hypothetical protein